MSTASCEFPLFRRKFLGAALWDVGAGAAGSSCEAAGTCMEDGGKSSKANHIHRPSLRALDLKALPREDGPPSETHLRRQKYQYFEKHCSEVAQGLFLAGDWVARNREVLTEHGITHVVNMVGFVCKEYFKGELEYKTYYLQDTPAEDILCVLYDAFEFIDVAMHSGGKVLVHCSQGVSRSTTIVIGYLMWKAGMSYDEAFAQVKAVRGVANPNIGFTCQLLQWQKRRRTLPAAMRMYRIAPHCQHAPLLLVPRAVTPPKHYPTHTWRELDPRGAFVIQTHTRLLYVWVGAQCPRAYAAAAERHAQLLPKYETTDSKDVVVCQQGSEPEELRRLLDPPALDPAAELANARRPSITGDLFASMHSSSSAGGGGAAGSNTEPMDTDSTTVSGSSNVVDNQGSSGSSSLNGTAAGPAGGSGRPPVPFILPPQLELPSGSFPSPAVGPGGSAPPTTSMQSLHAHPLRSPLYSSSLSTASPTLQHTNSLQGEPSLSSSCRWSAAPVDEYTPEYQLYMDAVQVSSAANSSRGMSTDGLGSSGRLGVSEAGGIQLRGAPSMRISVMGNEGQISGSSFPVVDAGLNGSFCGPVDSLPGAGLLARPDSPGSIEGRMKKYRRGTTTGNDSREFAAVATWDRHQRISLHQSLDDEEMP